MSDADSFPIGEAQIVALFMESVTYGMFLVTFGLCMRALLLNRETMAEWKRPRDIHWFMLSVAILMFVFATMDVAFGLQHNLQAFVFAHNPDGPDAVFSHLGAWVNVMKAVDFVFQTAIGDAILIYRCFAVYNQSWLVIGLPIALWLGTFACGLGLIWVESTTRHAATLDDDRLKPWLDTLTACTLAVNVLVTSLIVWRIRRVRSKTAAISLYPNRLSRVIRIVLDSGLIYTICVITFFGTTLAGSNAQYGVSDVVVQVIGITFNLIIIRVNNGTAINGFNTTTSGIMSHQSRGATYPMRFIHSGTTHLNTIPTEVGVEVEVNQTIDSEGSSIRKSKALDNPWSGAV